MKEIRPLSFLGGRVTAHMRRNIATALLLSIAAIAADASPLDPCGPPDLSCFVNDPDFSSPIDGIPCDGDPSDICFPGSLALTRCRATCESCIPFKDCQVQDKYAAYVTMVVNPVTSNANVFINSTRPMKAVQINIRCPSEDVTIVDAYDHAPAISSLNNVFVFLEDNKVFFLTMREGGMPYGSLELLVSLSTNTTCSQRLEISEAIMTDIDGETIQTCGTVEEPCNSSKEESSKQSSDEPVAAKQTPLEEVDGLKKTGLGCWISTHFGEPGLDSQCASRLSNEFEEDDVTYNLVSIPNTIFNARFNAAYKLSVEFDATQGLVPSIEQSGRWITAIGLQISNIEIYIGAEQSQEKRGKCLLNPDHCLTSGVVRTNGDNLFLVGKHGLSRNISIELVNRRSHSMVLLSSPVLNVTVDIIPHPMGWEDPDVQLGHLKISILKVPATNNVGGILGVGWRKRDSPEAKFHRLDSWNTGMLPKPIKAAQQLSQLLKKHRRESLFTKPSRAPSYSYFTFSRELDYEDAGL